MDRRTFVTAAGISGTLRLAGRTPAAWPSSSSPPADWRSAFPALRQQVNGHDLVYLDSAATTLKPEPVIEAIADYYRGPNANPSRTLHTLADRAASALDGARTAVASFIGATDPLEVVFTRGTTESLNLVAATWGMANVGPGDNILLGSAEHASNMLPWRNLAQRTGAALKYFGIDDDGGPSLSDLAARLTPRTKIVAFSHVSNVLGNINPVREMGALARAPGRIVVVDGAQSVPHIPVDVHELGADFLAFSAHKMLGPMGTGVLWGRRDLLDAMPPYQWGSNMAHDADLETEHLAGGALKYGAGTPNVSGPVGLAAALGFIERLGRQALVDHEHAISRRMIDRLGRLPGVRLLGTTDPAARVSVFTFTTTGRSPADLARTLDRSGIAIRAGDLAALPLLQRFGASSAARASCYVYTSLEEVDRFATALERALR